MLDGTERCGFPMSCNVFHAGGPAVGQHEILLCDMELLGFLGAHNRYSIERFPLSSMTM